MNASGCPDQWQWQLVVDEECITVEHVCAQTGAEEPLVYEPTASGVWCPICRQGLRVERTEEWPL